MLENITYNNHPCPQSESYWIPGYIPCIIYYISHNFFLQVEFVLVVSPMRAWLFHERVLLSPWQPDANITLCASSHEFHTWINCNLIHHYLNFLCKSCYPFIKGRYKHLLNDWSTQTLNLCSSAECYYYLVCFTIPKFVALSEWTTLLSCRVSLLCVG